MAGQTFSRVSGVAALSLVALLTLSSCSGLQSESSGASSTEIQSVPDSLTRSDGGAAVDGSLQAPSESEDSNSFAKKIVGEDDAAAEIFTANLSVRVKDPRATAQDVRQIATVHRQ